ncbi:MAG: hypothetical protein C4326_06545 [Ignavibacteria bacterium]
MKRSLILFISFIAVTVPLRPLPTYAQAGKAGLAFLKFGVSGRGLAMGDAMTAQASGAAATFYNPAGVLSDNSGSTQFLLMHREWIQDVRAQFLGVSVQLDEHRALGVSVNAASVSDIEVRTRPGRPEDTFTSHDFAVSATYAQRFSDHVCIGVSGKFLFEKIFVDDANGFAFDIGAHYTPPIDHLQFGIMLANIGSMKAMRTQKITLPALLRAGSGYSFPIESMTSELMVSADIVYVFPEKKSSFNFGGELMFDETVAARAGYQAGTHARGLSAGVGIKHDMFNLDYGFIPLAEGLGSGHTVSLAITF